MQFEARARLATKMYAVYIAEANERSNDEMRRLRKSYFVKLKHQTLGLMSYNTSIF